MFTETAVLVTDSALRLPSRSKHNPVSRISDSPRLRGEECRAIPRTSVPNGKAMDLMTAFLLAEGFMLLVYFNDGKPSLKCSAPPPFRF